MIQIFYSYILEEQHDNLIKKYLNYFPNDFQSKILNLNRWQDAQLSLIGRILLNEGISNIDLARMEREEIRYTKYNKPYLKNIKTKFNISHSGNIVICAFSNNTDIEDIGIDIEQMLDINFRDIKDQMLPHEWDIINNSTDKKDSFYDYWTKKECVIKASGEGLSISFKTFEIKNNISQLEKNIFLIEKLEINNNYKCHIAFRINKRAFQSYTNNKIFIKEIYFDKQQQIKFF